MATVLDRFGKFVNKQSNTFGKLVSRQVENQLAADLAINPFGTVGPTSSNPFNEDPIVNFARTNSSYSGTDCTLIVQLNNKLIILGNVETFTHSTHREKVPVRTLGRTHPKGFTAGGRTIAGSIVFITFDRAPLWTIIKEINYIRNSSDRTSSPLPDQLPPLDLILMFNNEYGQRSVVRLYGVEFLDEGTVYSINDLYSECTMQYVARDMDQMIAYEEIAEFKNMMFERQVRGQIVDNQFQAMLEYKTNIESQLSECNAKINEIDLELNRRGAAKIFTIGASELLAGLAYGDKFLTRDKLKAEKDKQIKIKTNLLNELEKVNKMISQNQLVGTWPNRGDNTGNMANDKTSRAPAKAKE